MNLKYLNLKPGIILYNLYEIDGFENNRVIMRIAYIAWRKLYSNVGEKRFTLFIIYDGKC